jgi:antitoxin VapB
MALRVNNPEADSLAKELASYTGETVTQAVIKALSERLEREKRRNHPSLAERLVQIGRECAALPVLDERTPDEMIGYDESGLPT